MNFYIEVNVLGLISITISRSDCRIAAAGIYLVACKSLIIRKLCADGYCFADTVYTLAGFSGNTLDFGIVIDFNAVVVKILFIVISRTVVYNYLNLDIFAGNCCDIRLCSIGFS